MNSTQRSRAKRIENWEKVFTFYGARRCMVCGVTSEHPIFELHHHDQAGKEVGLSSIMHHSWEKIELELRKCVLVCANCHRICHSVERARKR